MKIRVQIVVQKSRNFLYLENKTKLQMALGFLHGNRTLS